jgi:hypothetical protein
MRRFCDSLASVLVVLATIGAAGAETPSGGEFYQDFRGSQSPRPPLEVCGPDADLASHPEDQGWRITVPANQAKITNVGVMLRDPVKGDFEMTAGYEILQAEEPTGRSPAGFEFYLMTDTPTREAVGFSRWVNRDWGGEVYSCSRMTIGKNGKRLITHKHVLTQTQSGRLRVTRTGSEVTFWVEEGTEGFHELGRQELGAEDLAFVRLSAYAPPGHGPVDIRLVDLRIRANSLPFTIAESNLTIPTNTRRILVGLLGLAALLFLLGCAVVAVRKRLHPQKG